MFENKLEFGIYQIVNCMKIGLYDRVVIITDRKTDPLARLVKYEALRETGRVEYFIMEDFGKRPLKMPDEIMEVIKKSNVALRLADPAPGELPIFMQPIYDWVAKSNLRLASMPSITREIIEEGMNADYDKLKKFTARIYKILNSARRIEVRTALGTNLQVSVGKYKWIPCDGDIKPGHWSNLPDGEVFTTPENIEGRIVVDGVLGDYFDIKYGAVAKNPITIDIKDSFAVRGSLKCDNKDIEKDLKDYIFGKNLPNSARVGEFALGTNKYIKRIIGNMLQDEKYPGIHLAFGDCLGEETGAPFDCDSHCDCVILKPTIIIDGVKIMNAGKYLI